MDHISEGIFAFDLPELWNFTELHSILFPSQSPQIETIIKHWSVCLLCIDNYAWLPALDHAVSTLARNYSDLADLAEEANRILNGVYCELVHCAPKLAETTPKATFKNTPLDENDFDCDLAALPPPVFPKLASPIPISGDIHWKMIAFIIRKTLHHFNPELVPAAAGFSAAAQHVLKGLAPWLGWAGRTLQWDHFQIARQMVDLLHSILSPRTLCKVGGCPTQRTISTSLCLLSR